MGGLSNHPPTDRSDLHYSGPKLSPDDPFRDTIGARIGLHLNLSPNRPYFGKQTKYKVRINAFYSPISGPDGFSIDPENKGP